METKCKYQAGELYHLVGMLLMNWGWWQFHLSVMKVYHYFIIDQQTCYKYESRIQKKNREIKFHEIIFTKIFVKLISQKKEFWSKNYVNTLWCSKIVSNIFFIRLYSSVQWWRFHFLNCVEKFLEISYVLHLQSYPRVYIMGVNSISTFILKILSIKNNIFWCF